MTRPPASTMDWGLPVLLVLLVELVATGIPQYFRYDDAGWLHLARDHARDPWTLFSPALDMSAYSGLGSYYRPAVALLWWAIGRIAGPEPVAYEIVSGALFAVSVVYLFLAARLLAGRLAAWVTTAAFFAFLPLVGYGVYRMGSLHVGQAALLAAAYHLLRGAGGRARHTIAGLALALVAALARQSAVVILLAAAVAYLLAGPARIGRSRIARAAALLVVAGPLGALLLVLSPSTRDALSGAGALVGGGGAMERLAFYARIAVAPPHGVVLLAGALAATAAVLGPKLGARASGRRGAAILWAARLAPFGALGVVRSVPLAVLTLVTGIVTACLSAGRPAVLAAVWSAAALVPYLGHRVYYARYLEEAAYGLAFFAGVSTAVSVRRLAGRPRAAHANRPPAPRARPAVAGILVAILAAVAVPLGAPRLPLARGYAAVLARSRLHADNLRGLFDAVVQRVPRGAALLEPAVIGSAVREPSLRWAATADERESGLAPMEPRDATELLLALGRPDLAVRALAAGGPLPPSGDAGEWILCLNGAEAEAAARLPSAEPVFLAGAGDERTALYRVTGGTSGR